MKILIIEDEPKTGSTGIICDQRIALNGFYPHAKHPELLLGIRFKDPESCKGGRLEEHGGSAASFSCML